MLPKGFIISSTGADGQIDQGLLCVTGSTELEAKLSEALFLGLYGHRFSLSLLSSFFMISP